MSSDPGSVFDALGDPTRREVVARLGNLGEATPSEIARHLPISRQAVSKHLEVLARAGLVSFRRHGRQVNYRLTPEPFTDAVSWMAQVGSDWDTRLRSLRGRVREERR